jgi:N-acyl-D-amino-acid deacylase
LWFLATPSVFAENVVLTNGTVIDGSGKARVIGNIRIRDGKITDLGIFKLLAGETLLDVKGMIVAPGFIGLENASAAAFEKDLGAVSEISQGMTTVILGSDGRGPYSIEEFMLPFDEKPPALNIAMLVGHSTVRRQIMGSDYKRAATADQIDRMVQLVENAMRQGAFGFGTDLRNEPASFCTTDELLALAKAVGRFGGTFFVHPRDETIKEPVDVVRTAKVTLQLSLNNLTPTVLADIDRARMQGIDVGAHIYGFNEPGRELRSLLQNPSITVLFAQYLLDDKAISLERAIQKVTGLPASRIALKERGSLRKGLPADIVVFNPMAPSAGMKYVFVNGSLVLNDGQPTDARSGQALR